MKRALIISIAISVALAVGAGYCFCQWQISRWGSIVVVTPEYTEITVEEGDLFKATVPSDYILFLGYGRYDIRVPEYAVHCTVHKNCHGNTIIEVTGKNQYTVRCDWNAWLVTDDPRFKDHRITFGRWHEYRFP